MDVQAELILLVADFFGYQPIEIHSMFELAPNISSIDEFADFLYRLEETFSISIDESTLPLTTFKELQTYIELCVDNVSI